MSLSRYDAWRLASPPEGPEPCEEHDWGGEDEEDACPGCIAAEEDYEEMLAEERRQERRHGER